MSIYHPWFESAEYAKRTDTIRSLIAHKNCDAFVSFMPETVTYLTGFFTRGYSSFQFAVIPLLNEPVMFCRDVEEFYLDATCIWKNRVLWNDSDDQVALAAQTIRKSVGVKASVAIDLHAWPLSYGRFSALKALLPDITWVDISAETSAQRFIKSPAEIEYMRLAAQAAEAGMKAGIQALGVGVTERELAAEICCAMIKSGSDLPGPGVLSSGERALHLHGGYSDRILKAGDTVQLETTPNVKHYHSRFMRPMKVQSATDEEHRIVEQLIDIQDSALSTVKAGVLATVPDSIYREEALSRGLKEVYSNKTFYSVGLLLQPRGGEPLEAEPSATWRFEPGMTFHSYILANGFGMSETILVTESGYERLTNFPRKLFVSSL
ncbi:M24 family metallopeptidase [Vibrio astriarenae]